MISKCQQNLIKQCKAAGYGWAKFAKSVEAQEWCSEKQELTLLNMCIRLEDHKLASAKLRLSSYDHPGYDNISDNEAMRSGDYF